MLSSVSGRKAEPTSGRVRLLRAGLLGGLSLLLATGAHVAGGGTLPGAGVLTVAAVLLGLGAALVTARRCRFAVLAPLLSAQQVLLHILLGLAGGAAHVQMAPTVEHLGHLPAQGATATALDPGSLYASTTGSAMDMASPGFAMVLAHLAATLATAWLLARGEAWLWRAADSVTTAAGLRCTVRGRRAAAVVRVGDVASRRWECCAWLIAAPRGPPAVAAG